MEDIRPTESQRVVICNDCNWLGKLQDTDDYKGLWHCPICGSTELKYNDSPLPGNYKQMRLLRKAAPRLYEWIKGRAAEGDNDAKCFLSVLGLE